MHAKKLGKKEVRGTVTSYDIHKRFVRNVLHRCKRSSRSTRDYGIRQFVHFKRAYSALLLEYTIENLRHILNLVINFLGHVDRYSLN